MILGWRLIRFFLFSLLFAFGFTFIAIFIRDQKIAPIDQAIIHGVQGLESPSLTGMMKGFTFLGSTLAVAVLIVLIFLFFYKVFHYRSELILFIVVMAGSVLLNQVLKHAFHRTRPQLHRLIEETGYSFPSGHSMEAFAFYGILAFLLWKHLRTVWARGILLLFSVFMILAIGISRIYLGVHYPSDVAGGYLASGFWLFLTIYFYQWEMERRYERRKKMQRL
jgi:undecaprenyl-diphosphatase